MSHDHLFVYGTLRRDTKSEMYHLLARYADFVGEATYQGKLYRVDYYPGVVPSAQPHDVVHGEVYQLRYPDKVLRCLDEYEECGPKFSEPTEYIRRKEIVQLSSGNVASAWVYIFNRSTDELERIQSGDFLRQLPISLKFTHAANPSNLNHTPQF